MYLFWLRPSTASPLEITEDVSLWGGGGAVCPPSALKGHRGRPPEAKALQSRLTQELLQVQQEARGGREEMGAPRRPPSPPAMLGCVPATVVSQEGHRAGCLQSPHNGFKTPDSSCLETCTPPAWSYPLTSKVISAFKARIHWREQLQLSHGLPPVLGLWVSQKQ